MFLLKGLDTQMDFLDARTIMFMMLATYTVCTILVCLLWWHNRRRFRGTHLWAAGFIAQTLAVSLFLLRGVVPDGLGIVVCNGLFVGGALSILMGLERFLDRKGYHAHNVGSVIVLMLLLMLFTYVRPDLSARIISFSAVSLFLCVQAVWLLFNRVHPAARRLYRGVGGAFVGYCLVSVLRIVVHTLAWHDPVVAVALVTFEKLMLVTYTLLFVLLTYALSLMVNRKLLTSLQADEIMLARIVHAAPYALVLSRLSDGRILEANEAFGKMTGYPPEELTGKTRGDLNIWYDTKDRDAVINDLTAGEPVTGREYLFRSKSGDVICGLVWSERIEIDHDVCLLSFVLNITDRKQQQFEREAMIEDLQQALTDVKTLSGLLPICSSCKKIRDDRGYWNQLEAYLSKYSMAKFSHGICPDCTKRLYIDPPTPQTAKAASIQGGANS